MIFTSRSVILIDKELAAVVKIFLTLGHMQASVERGFSENNTVLARNMKVESIVARHLIKDHMIFNSLQPRLLILLTK